MERRPLHHFEPANLSTISLSNFEVLDFDRWADFSFDFDCLEASFFIDF